MTKLDVDIYSIRFSKVDYTEKPPQYINFTGELHFPCVSPCKPRTSERECRPCLIPVLLNLFKRFAYASPPFCTKVLESLFQCLITEPVLMRAERCILLASSSRWRGIAVYLGRGPSLRSQHTVPSLLPPGLANATLCELIHMSSGTKRGVPIRRIRKE